jgi:hypothetical protein
VEAARAQSQQGAAGFGFDEWTEHTCRRLGRAPGWPPHIEEQDTGSPNGQTFRDGGSNDARSDDGYS